MDSIDSMYDVSDMESTTKAPRGEQSSSLSHRKQKFRDEWRTIKQFKNWLEPVPDNHLKAYCCYCRLQMVSELTTLKKHMNSMKHINAAKSISGMKTGLFSTTTAIRKDDEAIKRAELKICGFIAEHNISFNSMDHLTQVLKDAFPDSKIAQGLHLGRTKSTNIVKNVIGQNHKIDLINDIKQTNFSIIIDESTDVGTLKTLCICIRYFNTKQNKIESKFWDLIQLFKDGNSANEGATAIRIYDEVLNSLRKEGVPLENVTGFASDGCNTMMGQWNSVSSRFKEDFPGVMIQKCICHSLALCASEACKVLPRR
ncbi:unnamed protein product [Aphis gossypii]|uniref:DUF4371 domain-containing protein n=1 Tax=Aphis gossypii TaxID=80765 RepID=A0A9P0JCB0_APHGO|nr:unnamed protein product [Aphis gossypii]